MQFDVAASWITAVLLCATRLGAVLYLTPILGGFSLPGRVKVMLVLGLSASCVSGLPHAAVAIPDGAGLLLALLAETGNGALFAYGVMTAFGAVAFAGKVLDIQAGFGLANVFDPVTRSQSPLIGSILGTLTVILFFTSSAHHALLRGIAFSLERLPLGNLVALSDPGLMVAQFGTVYSLGLLLAAPVMFCLFLLEIGMAVMSRNLPQMNVFMIGAPLKIAVALALMSLLGPQLGPVFDKIFAGIFLFWEALL